MQCVIYILYVYIKYWKKRPYITLFINIRIMLLNFDYGKFNRIILPFIFLLQCADFVKAGAEQGLTPSDVVLAADITFSCVADPQAAKDVSIRKVLRLFKNNYPSFSLI